MNLIARALHMPRDDVLQHRIQLAHQRPVARGLGHGLDGVEVPQRRIHRVVFRLLALIGKAIGQHAFVDKGREGLEDRLRHIVASGREAQAGQGDHRVAAPVAEPVIARDDGLADTGVEA